MNEVFVPLTGPTVKEDYRLGLFFKNAKDRDIWFANIVEEVPWYWDDIVLYNNHIYFTDTRTNIKFNLFLFVIGNYITNYNLDYGFYDKTINNDMVNTFISPFIKNGTKVIDNIFDDNLDLTKEIK